MAAVPRELGVEVVEADLRDGPEVVIRLDDRSDRPLIVDIKRPADTKLLVGRPRLLRAGTVPDGEVMLPPRLLNEDDLPRLTGLRTQGSVLASLAAPSSQRTCVSAEDEEIACRKEIDSHSPTQSQVEFKCDSVVNPNKAHCEA